MQQALPDILSMRVSACAVVISVEESFLDGCLKDVCVKGAVLKARELRNEDSFGGRWMLRD